MKEGKYIIEWDGDQWLCYHTSHPRGAVYGIGRTPTKAIKSFNNEIMETEKFIKVTSGKGKTFCAECEYFEDNKRRNGTQCTCSLHQETCCSANNGGNCHSFVPA